jgi:hypothetical protein
MALRCLINVRESVAWLIHSRTKGLVQRLKLNGL